MAGRQIDLKTAITLVSVGVALAGGGGTVIGSRAAASTEAKVDSLEIRQVDQAARNADYEARLRTLEHKLVPDIVEIKTDLRYIKAFIDSQNRGGR